MHGTFFSDTTMTENSLVGLHFSTECPLVLWWTPCSAQVYELMIWPDQVSCFVPGFRCVIFTSTACTFRFLGGIRLTLYVTSSPSTGTYSPSMLKEKSGRALRQDSKCFYEKKWSHAQLANVDVIFFKGAATIHDIKLWERTGSYFVQFLKAKPII